MKLNLPYRNTIEFTDNDISLLQNFLKTLLLLKNKKSKGKLYQKSDKLPFETKLLENYLRNENWFRPQQEILRLYLTILNYFQSLTISQFFNILSYLSSKPSPVNLDSEFENLEEVKNTPNSLQNKNNKINPITILNL